MAITHCFQCFLKHIDEMQLCSTKMRKTTFIYFFVILTRLGEKYNCLIIFLKRAIFLNVVFQILLTYKNIKSLRNKKPITINLL